MLITYLKDNGKIVPPIMTSETVLTLNDVLGEELGNIYSKIYDCINIADNMDLFDNFKNYYVDIETKELKEIPKDITYNKIQYL